MDEAWNNVIARCVVWGWSPWEAESEPHGRCQCLDSHGFQPSQHDWIRALECDDEGVREAARRMVQDFKLRRAANVLLAQFVSEETDPAERVRIGTVLGFLGSRKAHAKLAAWMRDHADPELREEAAYALTWAHEPGLAGVLLEAVQDSKEAPAVRAQAMEALGEILESYILGGLPNYSRSLFYRRLTEALIPYLHHDDPRLQFWSIFALGHKARCRRVLPDLEEIAANDKGVCPGWWSVAKEARDAIREIKGLRSRD